MEIITGTTNTVKSWGIGNSYLANNLIHFSSNMYIVGLVYARQNENSDEKIKHGSCGYKT